MKKLLASIFALTLTVPSVSFARDYNDHNRYEYREKRNNDGEVVIGVIAGAIIGGIIASSVDNDRDYRYNDRRYRDRYYNRYDRRERCYRERFRDRRGDIYTRRVCYR